MTKEHTEQPELLPCPFCGGDVGLEQAINSPGPRKWWGVVCRNTANLGGTCSIQQVPSASPDAAAKRWNRRAPASQARVPLSSTPAMIEAAESVEDLYKRGTPETWDKVWRAMLAASGITQEQG